MRATPGYVARDEADTAGLAVSANGGIVESLSASVRESQRGRFPLVLSHDDVEVSEIAATASAD